ncbi:uncharacterized protein [Nicotiana sylvestris]|uniref:uncharacterized protein n=1 Tax=Nicotiana sylvestris TaxID=4096 RepID=UPI00388C418C
MDQLSTDKEVVTTQLASAETQLRGIKAKGLSQTKKIEELEAELARAQAKAIQAATEAEKTKAAADKSIAIYLKDITAVKSELREASDWEKWSNDLAKCQDQRETLEEIHARGFDLAEAKARETDARFLVSSNDEDVASGSRDGEGEKYVPKGEEALEDRAVEGAVLRMALPGI